MSTKAQVILDAANDPNVSDEELQLLDETHEDQFHQEEVVGCMDENATNYDPKATKACDNCCILPKKEEEEETTITYEYPELEEVKVKLTPD